MSMQFHIRILTAYRNFGFRIFRILAISTIIPIAACGGGSDYGGSSGGGSGGGTGGNPYGLETPPAPTLSSIQEKVFTPICTECHAGASAPQGLRLEAGMSFGMLVNVASSEVPSVDRVEPGDPDNSYIIRKLDGTASVGERMPLGGPYLPDDTIAAIRQWITDGAMDNKPQAARAKPAQLSAGWPVNGSTVKNFSGKMLVIANAELDTTLINSRSIQLYRESAAGKSAIDSTVRVTSLSPTVIEVSAGDDLASGKYILEVAGSGASPLADRQGRLIDGDSDGKPGGDFALRFDVGVAE